MSSFFVQHAQCEDTQMANFHCRRNWASRARAVPPPIKLLLKFYYFSDSSFNSY
ncbi:UNVERIFIED_CONTAM: hypothetical protein FKN15_021496 [Acipenser sinensis]